MLTVWTIYRFAYVSTTPIYLLASLMRGDGLVLAVLTTLIVLILAGLVAVAP